MAKMCGLQNNVPTSRINNFRWNESRPHPMGKIHITLKGLPALGITGPGGKWEEAMPENKRIVLDSKHRRQLFELLIRAARK